MIASRLAEGTDLAACPRLSGVEAGDGLSIEAVFADGAAGVVDVSFLEVGGRWPTWPTRRYFESVRIDPATGFVFWGSYFDPGEAEWVTHLHPGWLYAEIKGMLPPQGTVPCVPEWRLEDTHVSLASAAEPRSGLCVWVRLENGQEGEIDLSPFADERLARAWSDRGFFERVEPDPVSGRVRWAWQDDVFVYLDPGWLHGQVAGHPVDHDEGSPLRVYDRRRLPEPTSVEPREGLRIWIEYEDGLSGEIDLGGFASWPIFRDWQDRTFFESVRLLPVLNIPAWGTGDDLVDIDPDSLYVQLSGKTRKDLLPPAPWAQ